MVHGFCEFMMNHGICGARFTGLPKNKNTG